MKHLVFAGVAAIALLASGPSFGQGVGVQVGPVVPVSRSRRNNGHASGSTW